MLCFVFKFVAVVNRGSQVRERMGNEVTRESLRSWTTCCYCLMCFRSTRVLVRLVVHDIRDRVDNAGVVQGCL